MFYLFPKPHTNWPLKTSIAHWLSLLLTGSRGVSLTEVQTPSKVGCGCYSAQLPSVEDTTIFADHSIAPATQHTKSAVLRMANGPWFPGWYIASVTCHLPSLEVLYISQLFWSDSTQSDAWKGYSQHYIQRPQGFLCAKVTPRTDMRLIFEYCIWHTSFLSVFVLTVWAIPSWGTTSVCVTINSGKRFVPKPTISMWCLPTLSTR